MQKIKIFFITLLSFFLLLQISSSYAVEFKNDRLHVKFDTQNTKVLNWKILNKSMSLPYDLIKENKSSFGLEGIVDGYDLNYWVGKAGGWSVEQNSNQIIFQLRSENLPFELKKFWKFNQNSYEVDLSYELVPKKNLNDTNLYLNLGPGIGEKPIKGLGISDVRGLNL